jgi:hypothetical protein
VVTGGLIHLISMSMISFVMFVLFKALGSTGVQSWFQHAALASYVGLMSIILSIICSTSMKILIIPFGIAYISGSSYIHVNAYNQALKPQLHELIVVGLLIVFFYVSTGTFKLKKFTCFITTTMNLLIPQFHRLNNIILLYFRK